MSRLKLLKWLCYSLFPILSVFVILAVSWLLSAIMEIYTNNLTMFKILDQTTKYNRNNNNREILHEDISAPGESADRVFWFVQEKSTSQDVDVKFQITDLHISKYRDYGQVDDLKSFCRTDLRRINPDFLLVTGDLTDAKDRKLIGSQQYIEEWQTYESLRKYCGDDYIKWIDVRGNHDAFAVSDTLSSDNLFNTFASSKHKYDRSGLYQFIHKKPYGLYAFNGIDIAPNPGPPRPFNFFAVPNQNTMVGIEDLAGKVNLYNTTVWFGHYPLSITTETHALRALIGSGVAYLCGHLHTFLGTFPQMHAVHDEGFVELELGDWKENRRYRICAIDHDMFSFVDVTYPDATPVILLTNPVDARYLVPGEKAYLRSRNSTHIRFLVFYHLDITDAMISIDGETTLCTKPKVSGPLFTCPWNAQKYMIGVHHMKISVKVSDGSSKSVTIPFSLDGTKPPLGILSTVLLLTDFYTMARMVFFTSIIVAVVLPLLLKKFSQQKHIALIRMVVNVVTPQIIYFIDCNDVFYPLCLYSAYISVGPSCIGYLLPNELSLLFPYGILSTKNFILGSLSYIYVAWQLILFNFVLIFYIGEIISQKSDISFRNLLSRSNSTRLKATILNGLFIFLLWHLVMDSVMFWIAYGKLSALLNPLKTWSIILAFYLKHKAYNTVERRLK